MPGHIIHLAAASRLLQFLSMNEQEKNAFLLGAVAPDILEKSDKRISHFWTEEGFAKFNRIPNTDMFRRKYDAAMTNPFVLGYYSHLYMDALFMKTSWQTHFTFYDEQKQPNDLFDKVAFIGYRKRPEDEIHMYRRDIFFSNAYYYGDYDLVNPYIIKTYDVKVPTLPAITLAHIDEVVLEQGDRRMAKLLEAANRFKAKPNEDASREYTDAHLKVFLVSEFEYLIEKTINEIKSI